MHKVYLLLRNNRQEGPYNLEELLTQSLQPSDLIWVEGKSAGWRNPAEIDSLKPFVSAAGKTEVESQSTAVVSAITENTRQKHIYVCLPGHASGTIKEPAHATGIESEESFTGKLEKKAEELYRKIQAYQAEGKQGEEASAEVDTKYSRSLDDIKREYANWLHEQKRNQKRGKLSNKLIILSALTAAGIFIILFWLWPGKQEAGTQVPETAAMELGSHVATFSTMKGPSEDRTKKIKGAGVHSISKTTKKNKQKTTAPGVAKPGSVKKAKAKPQNTSLPGEEKKTTARPEPPLPQLIKVSGSLPANTRKGIPEFMITVRNNSNEPLRFVAVDVFYYRNNGSLSEKKTLYFRNLSPHQSLALTAPSNRKAGDVRYQLGLISGADGSIYYAKQ